MLLDLSRLDQFWLDLTYLDFSWLDLTYLDFSWPDLTYLDLSRLISLSWPILISSLDFTSPDLTFPWCCSCCYWDRGKLPLLRSTKVGVGLQVWSGFWQYIIHTRISLGLGGDKITYLDITYTLWGKTNWHIMNAYFGHKKRNKQPKPHGALHKNNAMAKILLSTYNCNVCLYYKCLQ